MDAFTNNNRCPQHLRILKDHLSHRYRPEAPLITIGHLHQPRVIPAKAGVHEH